MTNEDWERSLGEKPFDADLRRVYADWLEERGEWDGPAVREMAERGLYPEARNGGWWFWCHGGVPRKHKVTIDEWMDGCYAGGMSRRKAEEDLRRVIYERTLKAGEDKDVRRPDQGGVPGVGGVRAGAGAVGGH